MDTIVMVFEFKNCQEDFARFMWIIKKMETEHNEDAPENDELMATMPIRYCWLKSNFRRQFTNNEIVENIEKQRNGNSSDKVWNLHNISDVNQVVKDKHKYDIRYYVCVKTTREEDIKNIQYLILLLQQFKKIKDRICVFLEPYEGYYDLKEGSFGLYYKYSHYMRFIIPKYKNIFFSAYEEKKNNKVNIVPLSSKKHGIQSTFFPLIEIDSTTHTLLSHYCFLNESGLIDFDNNNVESSELIDVIEIAQKILEVNLKEKFKTLKEKNIIKNKIYSELRKQGITSLEYVVFAVLLSSIKTTGETEVWNCLQRAKSIVSGLIQLIENVVRHSVNHVGTFTLRIISDSKRYLETFMEDEIEGYSAKVLEIDICDANMKESLMDNFIKKISHGEQYFRNIKPAVAHFFEEYRNDEEEKAWIEYRKDFPVQCLGLKRLRLELDRCEAILHVRSNPLFTGEIDNLSYQANFYNEIALKKQLASCYIPGTQFQIILPMFLNDINKAHNANMPMNEMGNIKEDDSVYASLIDYIGEEVPLKEVICQIDEEAELPDNSIVSVDKWMHNMSGGKININRKDDMVALWRTVFNKWNSTIDTPDRIIYYINMKEVTKLVASWGIETFCKGFVDCDVLKNENVKCLVFTNCREEFIDMFFNTVVFAKEKISSEVQIFLHADNEIDDFLITGKNIEEIKSNVIQYSYFKGTAVPKCIQKINDKTGKRQPCGNIIELIPYDVFLKKEGTSKTLFECYIEKVADHSLTDVDKAGYLLSDAHMRLGNKVHLEQFYEIAILFRKPRIARKIALMLIKNMLEDGVEFSEDLLFYGYASYSRVILVALVEIVKKYKEQNKISDGFVGFAVYQNDIQIQKSLTDISAKARMYFDTQLAEEAKLNIIQIVPISSTLTTFKKMWDIFPKNSEGKLVKNYTLFWVRDKVEKKSIELPTDIEKTYWSKIVDEVFIDTELISPLPRFFCCKNVGWHQPLNCEWCYPNNVVDEKALIETDVTSTVPSQQLEVNLEESREEYKAEDQNENEERIVGLEDCIFYGHVCRDNNHFQYYIDTNKYFNKQKISVMEWLKSCKNNPKEKVDKVETADILNIIVTPQHHTNVEFCHYVNNYLFDGAADIITIDSTKEYRSNVVAKYADVKCAIDEARKRDTKVIFSYVDDTIITGNTFYRVNSLVQSLVPKEDVRPLQFEKVFVLINRLSCYSKKDYVSDAKNNFMSYVDISVSSIRNFGDSCMMCTLEKNAKLFASRASTRALSRYWQEKQYDYRHISFDKYLQEENVTEKMENGYIRLLCSHYAKRALYMGNDEAKNIIEIVKLILMLKEDEQGKESAIYEKVLKKNAKTALKAYFKIFCRPFFAYGKIYRQAALDLYLLLAQCFVAQGFCDNLCNMKTIISKKKKYLNNSELRKEIIKLYEFISELFPSKERVQFVLDYILEGLADLRSNYIIRFETIFNMKSLVECEPEKSQYYEIYERLIHRVINGSADETKSLWLEKMLYTGKENISYMDEEEAFKPISFADEEAFALFWDSLFVDNTRLYYDSMLNFLNKVKHKDMSICYGKEIEGPIKESVNLLWDDYYIQNLRKFIKLEILSNGTQEDEKNIDDKIKDRIISAAKLLYLLKNCKKCGLERYVELKECIKDMLYRGDELKILTKATEEDEYCSVTDYKKGDLSYDLIKNMRKAVESPQLERKGFYVGEGHIVLNINNNYIYLKDKTKEKNVEVQPVYFYVTCDTKDLIKVKLRIRYLLMYRHQLLKWIEEDFNNNALPTIVTQMLNNRQLMRDKAGDHSSRQDIAVNHRLLQSGLVSKVIMRSDEEGELFIWLLLRSYVNMRVARLFRSEWSASSKELIYTKAMNSDAMNGPLINLGDSFFGERLKGLSPKRYFEFVGGLFQFNIYIGEAIENATFDDMQNVFRELRGRECEEYYYKEEFIICIILDILFSAIKNCRNWEIGSDEFCNKKLFNNVFTDTDANIAHYFVLKDSKDKCRIDVLVEKSSDESIDYFVLKNRVHGIKKCEVLEQKNKKFQDELFTKQGAGLSIQTIQWYTENLDEKNKIPAKFEYIWNDERNEAEFVTKLPILKRK